MTKRKPDMLNVALVGGGDLCRQFLRKASLAYNSKELNARIIAVADPDPESPGIRFARELGLTTLKDFRDFLHPEFDIDIIAIMTPEEGVLDHILERRSKDHSPRVIAYPVFQLFWKVITVEEEQLRRRNKEIETVLNGIQDCILVMTPEREIVEANDAFLNQMRYTREEVIGRKCYEIFQKESAMCSAEYIDCPLSEVIRNKQPSQQVLTRLDHNGDLRYIEVTLFPMWEKDGKISKFIEISRDITDRKKQEEEITFRLEKMVEERARQLDEAHTKLLHQDKMASLGKLSASVVHEINNPIAGVLNLIILMKRILREEKISPKEIEQFSRYMTLMETETRRISRIVSNLLAFSRQSPMEFKQVDLNRLLESTLFLNSNLLKINGVKVEKDLDAGLPKLYGSEDQLQQVFMNLVSNSAEAIEAAGGGTMTIRTRFSAPDNTVLITFSDTGIGIKPGNESRLFEPFFTTKKKGKGVGLGLSVAYGIIEDHGGSILFQSQEGKGTTFEIELPLKHLLEDADSQGDLHGEHEDPNR